MVELGPENTHNLTRVSSVCPSSDDTHWIKSARRSTALVDNGATSLFVWKIMVVRICVMSVALPH
jgi:hypothetical protein